MEETLATPLMTNDEMIELLKGMVFGNFQITAKEREALDRAITIIEKGE